MTTRADSGRDAPTGLRARDPDDAGRPGAPQPKAPGRPPAGPHGIEGQALQEAEAARDVAEAARDVAEAAQVRLTLVARAGALIAEARHPVEALRRLVRSAVPALADITVAYRLGERGTLRPVAGAYADPAHRRLARALQTSIPLDALPGVHPVAEAIRTARPVVLPSVGEAVLRAVALDEAHLAALRAFGLTSGVVLPLLGRERVLGALVFAAAGSGRRYGEADLPPFEILARQCTAAVEQAALFAREHRIAATMQRASLPRDLPIVPGVELSASYRPATREAEVGGDWYDAFRLPDGRLALSLGDVAGRGLRAAVAMGQVRPALRAAALEGASPAAVLDRVSRLLQLDGQEEMASAIFGIFDPVTLAFTYATAGHPPPLLGRPDGRVEVLPHGGPPLGIWCAEGYADTTVTLAPGALLVLYTDGLVEATRNLTEGLRRLMGVVGDQARAPGGQAAAAIQHALLRHEEARDDVAVVVLRVQPIVPDGLRLTLPARPSAVRIARQAVSRLAAEAGLDRRQTLGVQVAVSEAVSNIIEHAYGPAGGPIHLHAFLAEGRLTVEVRDVGRWRTPREEGRGRGLALMRALADRVTIERGETGTTVRVDIALRCAGARPAAP